MMGSAEKRIKHNFVNINNTPNILQWRYMSIKAYQIIDNSTVGSTARSSYLQKSNAEHHWPIVRGIYRSPVVSHTKGK